MMIHVVREGDTLYKIAQQYGLPLQTVLRENELAEPDKLTPGQVVVIRCPRQTCLKTPTRSISSMWARQTPRCCRAAGNTALWTRAILTASRN